jgi:hypothetical protein
MRGFAAIRILFATAPALALCWALAAPGSAAAHPRCTIVGTPGSDVLHGTPGADVICGRGGDDTLIGGGGNDVLIGGTGEDTLEGGPGNDLLLGGAGADTLKGGSGWNLLRGGPGRNDCFGGIEHGCEVPKAKAQSIEPIPPHAPFLGEVAHPCVAEACHPQVEPQRDEQAPEFWYLEMSRRSADIENGDGSISFRADAWDNVGITKATVNVAAPDGSPWLSVPLTARDEFDVVGNVEVPQESALGVYTVESLEFEDAAGNEKVVDRAELVAGIDEDEFSVYEGADTEPPTLESFTITPGSTPTSAGPVDVHLDLGTADARSGVKRAWVTVKLPNDPPPPYEYAYSPGAHEISGTQDEGVEEAIFELPQWAYPGAYSVSEVMLEDFAGNQVHLETPELEALGFPIQFEATGPGDTTPPEIVGVRSEPSTIPAEGTVITYVHVRDDLSGFGVWPNEGFSQVYVGWDWPNVTNSIEMTGHAPELVSGDALDGTWKIETTFLPVDPPGAYTLDYVGAYDRAMNGGPMRQPELEAHGWDLGFTKLP